MQAAPQRVVAHHLLDRGPLDAAARRSAPLSGPVYFVKNVRKDAKTGREIRTLPKLVIPLVGQNGLKLTLTGTSDVVDDQLVTTFEVDGRHDHGQAHQGQAGQGHGLL